jgi:methyl-accepting chemotaxis protein
VQVTGRVADSLQRTITNAGKVAQLVGEIATGSQEQAQGIQQVSTAVSEMDKVTQSNAAGAEESASASEELNAQAGSLKDVVAGLQRLVGGAGHSGEDSLSAPTVAVPARSKSLVLKLETPVAKPVIPARTRNRLAPSMPVTAAATNGNGNGHGHDEFFKG